jgi:hypothetical protein
LPIKGPQGANNFNTMIEMIGEVVFVLVPFLLIHMSLIKLKKSNRRPIPVPQSQRQHKPVFLGDSSDFAVQYITGANKYKRILKEILAAEVHTSFSLHSHQYLSSHFIDVLLLT